VSAQLTKTLKQLLSMNIMQHKVSLAERTPGCEF